MTRRAHKLVVVHKNAIDYKTAAVRFILAHEGGYAPSGPGGQTNYGITYITYCAKMNINSRTEHSSRSFRRMTQVAAGRYYETEFMYQWNTPYCSPRNNILAIVLLDTRVQWGDRKAYSMCFEAFEQFSAKNNRGPTGVELAKALIYRRMAFRYKNVHRYPWHKKYLRGWLKRDKDLMDVVNAMVARGGE